MARSFRTGISSVSSDSHSDPHWDTRRWTPRDGPGSNGPQLRSAWTVADGRGRPQNELEVRRPCKSDRECISLSLAFSDRGHPLSLLRAGLLRHSGPIYRRVEGGRSFPASLRWVRRAHRSQTSWSSHRRHIPQPTHHQCSAVSGPCQSPGTANGGAVVLGGAEER